MEPNKFATCYGRDVRVVKEYHGKYVSTALVQSMGEPFYTEYTDENDMTYGMYEYMIWVPFDLLTNVRAEEQPADLPLSADPRDDEPLPVEMLDARADYAQINDLQMTGRGG